MNGQKVTPLMEQYFAIKSQFTNALLFFQVGDFYELFFDDAIQAAPVLGIALTQRGNYNNQPIPLCGVPIHALDHYLAKLIKAGLLVAIADQLEVSRPGTVVKRGITRVLTPGTLTEKHLLDEKRTSYLCSLYCTNSQCGFAVLEILTGQLLASTLNLTDARALDAQLHRFMPDEIILDGPAANRWKSWLIQNSFFISQPIQQHEQQTPCWLAQLSEKYPVLGTGACVLNKALEQLYWYIQKNQPTALSLCTKIHIYKAEDFLVIDGATARNLELVVNAHDASSAHTLFSVLDKAATAMGSRLIKKWILSPLINLSAINNRLAMVQVLVSNIAITQHIYEFLKELGDLERVIGRIALNRAQLYDYLHLKSALQIIPSIQQTLIQLPENQLIQRMQKNIQPLPTLAQLLDSSLNTDTNKPWLIKAGFDHQLELLREALAHEHDIILQLEHSEQERTRISSLKIRYNNVQGYYIEITKPNLHLVPTHYERHQTLANVERYSMPQLREIEHRLMRARTEINVLEQEIYERIKQEVAQQLPTLRQLAQALATLDAIIGFSLTAYDNNYCCPQLHEQRELTITQGVHPVVGLTLNMQFIPNNTTLNKAEQIWIITGPNMGGKSTYLRQVALICLMAHCGSFVPAKSAQIPLLDRIFTRVGAGDNLAEGKSTFLIEMEETASICTQATEKSLVILDEVGRGTSTYDGMAIAQAVIEHIHIHMHAFCLFATHYHELTRLDDRPGIVNYHAACVQKDNRILFLHTIIKGAAQGSFGIYVAKLAQLPQPIIDRAQEILDHLTQDPITTAPNNLTQTVQPARNCTACKNLRSILEPVNPDELSPRQAHALVYELKKEIS